MQFDDHISFIIILFMYYIVSLSSFVLRVPVIHECCKIIAVFFSSTCVPSLSKVHTRLAYIDHSELPHRFSCSLIVFSCPLFDCFQFLFYVIFFFYIVVSLNLLMFPFGVCVAKPTKCIIFTFRNYQDPLQKLHVGYVASFNSFLYLCDYKNVLTIEVLKPLSTNSITSVSYSSASIDGFVLIYVLYFLAHQTAQSSISLLVSVLHS